MTMSDELVHLPAEVDVSMPLGALDMPPRARSACAALGLRTLRELLATRRDQLLAVPGCGVRTVERLVATLQKQLGAGPPTTTATILLPPSLLTAPLGQLGLDGEPLRQLHELGCTTLQHALQLPARSWSPDGVLGPAGASAVRSALEGHLRLTSSTAEAPRTEAPLDWPSLQEHLLAPLAPADRELVCQFVGLGAPPRRLADIGRDRGLDLPAVRAAARAASRQLHGQAATLLARLRAEIERELLAFEGIVTGEYLAPGTMLHALAKASGNRATPLRLCALCFPDDFHLRDGYLSTVPRRRFRRFVARLRRATAARCLPLPLTTLTQDLARIVDPVPRGLLLHLLRRQRRVAVQIDPQRGELVTSNSHSVPRRLLGILQEAAQPQRLDDLVFAYRERYRTARATRILHWLRRDQAFVEVGPGAWSLRAWHAGELDAARQLAGQVAARVTELGGKQVLDGLQPAGTTARMRFLVLDCLRQERRVRHLGRAEFCPATHQKSQVLDRLLQDLRCAGSDIVLTRFLANQPSERRGLVKRLLQWNRLFLMPAPDRIDLLTNYPFAHDRLQRLLAITDRYLASHGGYSATAPLLTEIQQTDLGGSYMNPTILTELLRRHGPFEVLAGDFVARRRSGLGGWLMARARAALRTAGVPITIDEIVATRPELAEFRACLGELLDADPMIMTPDGMRYQVV
jgi:hypothetical protein